ncbi:unnamed protein product [Polarella glacialis]|uniref:Uncharacterized protein n=1 Tax=Polarella glacialis TaxID=89957 RepID=A0A813JHU1_POLGL|nr:unnamed protein product [Polarella glacialis]
MQFELEVKKSKSLLESFQDGAYSEAMPSLACAARKEAADPGLDVSAQPPCCSSTSCYSDFKFMLTHAIEDYIAEETRLPTTKRQRASGKFYTRIRAQTRILFANLPDAQDTCPTCQSGAPE